MSNPINFYDLTSEQLSDNGKLHTMDAYRAIEIAREADPANALNAALGAAGATQLARAMADLLRHRADRASLLASQMDMLVRGAENDLKEYKASLHRAEEMDPPEGLCVVPPGPNQN